MSYQRMSIGLEVERARRRQWSRVRRGLYRSQKGHCHYCGRLMKLLASKGDPGLCTIDHRKPLASGGTDDPSNLVAACRRCNVTKGETYDGQSRPEGECARILPPADDGRELSKVVGFVDPATFADWKPGWGRNRKKADKG